MAGDKCMRQNACFQIPCDCSEAAVLRLHSCSCHGLSFYQEHALFDAS